MGKSFIENRYSFARIFILNALFWSKIKLVLRILIAILMS